MVFGLYEWGQNESFPIFILAFKIFIFIVFQNHHICQIFKKLWFIISIEIASVLSIVYSDFLIFDNVTRVTLKNSLIRIRS